MKFMSDEVDKFCATLTTGKLFRSPYVHASSAPRQRVQQRKAQQIRRKDPAGFFAEISIFFDDTIIVSKGAASK
jgi:hypothetical protein